VIPQEDRAAAGVAGRTATRPRCDFPRYFPVVHATTSTSGRGAIWGAAAPLLPIVTHDRLMTALLTMLVGFIALAVTLIMLAGHRATRPVVTVAWRELDGVPGLASTDGVTGLLRSSLTVASPLPLTVMAARYSMQLAGEDRPAVEGSSCAAARTRLRSAGYDTAAFTITGFVPGAALVPRHAQPVFTLSRSVVGGVVALDVDLTLVDPLGRRIVTRVSALPGDDGSTGETPRPDQGATESTDEPQPRPPADPPTEALPHDDDLARLAQRLDKLHDPFTFHGSTKCALCSCGIAPPTDCAGTRHAVDEADRDLAVEYLASFEGLS